ncbi:MAG: hypothetical protein R6X22_00910 [Gemmatimonadota bacterium]
MRKVARAALVLVLLPTAAAAQEPDWTDLRFRRQADGVRSIDVQVAYAAGELEVGPADPGLLYDVDLRYDALRLRPERSWEAKGDAGRLALRLGPADGQDGNWKLDGAQPGRLRLGLGPDAAAALSIEVGAAEAQVRLGGIPLTSFTYRTGASSTVISFDAPNPERMSRLELAAGAAEFEATGLGNARFQHLEFEGAVGDVTLDFRGAWSSDAEADISVGLGALRLVLPRGVGVEIEKKGFLTGFDPGDMRKADGVWRTPDWGDARHHLRIRLRAAFGRIEVAFAD